MTADREFREALSDLLNEADEPPEGWTNAERREVLEDLLNEARGLLREADFAEAFGWAS